MRARVATLAMRAASEQPAPEIDGDGLLRFRGGWVSLSPVCRTKGVDAQETIAMSVSSLITAPC